jgi:hypothetical protein
MDAQAAISSILLIVGLDSFQYKSFQEDVSNAEIPEIQIAIQIEPILFGCHKLSFIITATAFPVFFSISSLISFALLSESSGNKITFFHQFSIFDLSIQAEVQTIQFFNLVSMTFRFIFNISFEAFKIA